ncbi:DUF1439 domain-containing protein [Ottowia thiooxydans]|uniref:DUF1439 domain-containing protein n=1 Tax=Ottowia thiooxydans TaxID=219182 RepID=UPI0004112707|nr:DUF1439 domain-containing protein [Ottowia thiooxydans]
MPNSPHIRLITRRQGLGALAGIALAGLLITLPACANRLSAGADGTRSYTLPRAQLEELIGKKFPQQRRLSGLIDVTLQRPRLQLLPETNRLGTSIDLTAAEMLLGTRYEGRVDLDYGIRFDAADGSIRMVDVRVGKVDFPSVPQQYQPLFARAAPRMVEQLLNGMVLQEIKPDQLALVNGLGYRVGEVRVTREGLRVELLPALPGP